MSLLRNFYDTKSDHELLQILAREAIPVYPWTTRFDAVNQLIARTESQLQARPTQPMLWGAPSYQSPPPPPGPVPYFYR